MDKQFWISIMKSDYEIPAGYSVLTLTDELFSTIGSNGFRIAGLNWAGGFL